MAKYVPHLLEIEISEAGPAGPVLEVPGSRYKTRKWSSVSGGKRLAAWRCPQRNSEEIQPEPVQA
ncbi:hypothetical protein CH63R_10267 [Colletotrichum higginsianum IMI 349063]|uniref:Uncharacterized protein n=1 Tax=Colletotrichum higginsianum (strain IMI 349063) TaxID=759273 RepID=A0A1B7Y2C5_COLHI|nr:uncharacterized protein CH63R_10267 [Colletotrichum higginsianum IMI 349063]OBR06147.1 hypothetical protein CH63R_10267 [Colletotrichum higginsianum IMI 349063]